MKNCENWRIVYDVKNKKYGDFCELGIIDSFHNVSHSLHDSCSIGGYLLTTECIISNKEVYVPRPYSHYEHVERI